MLPLASTLQRCTRTHSIRDGLCVAYAHPHAPAAGFAATLRENRISVPSVGVGSTPTCSVPPSHMAGIDEMHPGNFLYYDTTQQAIGM